MGDGLHPGLFRAVQVRGRGGRGQSVVGSLASQFPASALLQARGSAAHCCLPASLCLWQPVQPGVPTCLPGLLLCRRQINLSRKFSATELEHVMAYSDGRDGLLADIHIVSRCSDCASSQASLLAERLGCDAPCCECRMQRPGRLLLQSCVAQVQLCACTLVTQSMAVPPSGGRTSCAASAPSRMCRATSGPSTWPTRSSSTGARCSVSGRGLQQAAVGAASQAGWRHAHC